MGTGQETENYEINQLGRRGWPGSVLLVPVVLWAAEEAAAWLHHFSLLLPSFFIYLIYWCVLWAVLRKQGTAQACGTLLQNIAQKLEENRPCIELAAFAVGRALCSLAACVGLMQSAESSAA